MKKSLVLFLCSLLIILPQVIKAQQTPQGDFSPEAVQRARQRLQEIKARIKNSEDFYKYAKLYSDDPGSAKNGGCYDSLKRDVFVPEFEGVAFSMKVGEISDIFATKFGLHIIYLRAKRENEVDVCHILIIPK